MKRIASLFILLSFSILASCGTQKEAFHEATQEVPQKGKGAQESAKDAAPSDESRDTSLKKPPTVPHGTVGTFQCREDTSHTFNLIGIDAMPFMRVAFYDVDGDGRKDMIVGSKGGSVLLYKNTGEPRSRRWQIQEGYFDGIKANAFSSPAMGDIDGDGEPEVVVGTGGFSSDSGRILFFKNAGSRSLPSWHKIEGTDIRVGNDATVTLVDYNFDGKPDIIAGNSSGKVFFFKNVSAHGKIRFVQEKVLERSFGLYAVPTAVTFKDKVILVVGNDQGRLSLFELKKNGAGASFRESKIKVSAQNFASPSFTDMIEKDRFDLVLTDGDGMLSYFENKNHDFTVFEENQAMFNSRVFTGPACAPTVCSLGDRTVLVIGNIDGTLRLFESLNTSEGLPWIERRQYFSGIKVSGFSRGILTTWAGREILIAGQSNGDIRAFISTGSDMHPLWREEKRFFRGIHITEHSTPTLFDIDGDGQWELITGAEDGRVYAYRIKEVHQGLPVWEKIKGLFEEIRVDRFSSPTLAWNKDSLYLFVGQQDGRIRTYKSEHQGRRAGGLFDYRTIAFTETTYLKDIRMRNHSSPFIKMNGDILEIVSGDYDGNLRHFSCTTATLLSDLKRN